jgi:crossover junction endodeoxyribonuclease RuvC
MATFTAGDLTLPPVAVVRILGIDPGTRVVGYGCLELTANDPVTCARSPAPMALRGSNVVSLGAAAATDVRLVGAGVLRLGVEKTVLSHRLLALAQQFRDLLATFCPDEVALEEAFYGKSVQAALRIGEARGVVLAESARAGADVHQYAPARVKRCVTGHGAAAKPSVAAMLAQLLPQAVAMLPRSLPADATDAVAVAWTRLEERRSPLLGGVAGGSALPRPRRGSQRGAGR